MNKNIDNTDILIIGSGVAGAVSAIHLADKGFNVVVVTKAINPEETNTYYAQGGIIAEGKNDSVEMLKKDVMTAGAGFTNPEAAEMLASIGPKAVRDILINRVGVEFDKHGDELSLTKEGGHAIPRIVHSADATGKAIQKALIKTLQSHSKIKLISNMTAVDLLTPSHHADEPQALYEPLSCVGAYLLNNETQEVITCKAKHTVLATGGLGQIFEFTTNPLGARGDGVAMAHRAGARVSNLEFIQFHPTTFFHQLAPRFLITEAVRGEGGKLTNASGEPFMQNYDAERKDLATRDIVARAIYTEMMNKDLPCAYLDLASNISKGKILERFPTIYETLLKYNIDITKDLVPVVPAAHYSCGGVWVDTKTSETTIKNLYAVGEVACNGLHGANRLASTSLLEGVVWGQVTAQEITKRIESKSYVSPSYDKIRDWKKINTTQADPALVAQDEKTIKGLMWNYVGLVRNKERLARARTELGHIERSIEHFYQNTKVSVDILGLRNLVRTAVLVTEAAWANKNSAGCHYRVD